ncbi:VWA domain-containing protein [Amaricoccus macauensis]|uniref:VWA domain-containing protein n=1 Tax=Amaricoccus macauensis TaxID=57001 RepID=UPI003C7BAC79
MSELAIALEAFHFLRPLWLLLLPVIALLWVLVRRSRARRAPPEDGIAPHLRAALTVGAERRRRIRPVDGVALALTCATLGAAGPTWSRVPDPLVSQAAPVVVALEVTPSMEETDIAPSRLERAKQKIRDFLDLRGNARTALVAYSGSAHVVVPMAQDPSIIVPYLEGLSPDVMPREGAQAGRALSLAQSLLSAEDAPGAILFVTDALDPADAEALNGAERPLSVLAMLPDGTNDRRLDALSAQVLRVTPDDGDVRRLDRLLNAAYRQALLEDADQPWEDRGAWLAWPAALLLLLWFRRGWTMRWAAILLAGTLAMPPAPARADGIADWFLTPDQQGQIAFRNKDFSRAAELFADPLWRGYALYRDGQYGPAIEVLDRVDTAQAAFIQGLAQIRNRGYRDGVRAFETAVERDPDYPGAAENLAVARQIVAYVERVQEQSDIGEQEDMGADDVRFDNEENRGEETRMEVPQQGDGTPLTADQWMMSVETQTGDFLRQRFALEAAQERGE